MIIDTKDVRIGSRFWPMGLLLWEDTKSRNEFILKEIVIVAPENHSLNTCDEYLDIIHRYLLIYIHK